MKYNGGNIQKLDKVLDKSFTNNRWQQALTFYAILMMGLAPVRGESKRLAPESKLPTLGQNVRIVSLSPSATEMLFYIGAGAQVVGRTNACNYPEQVHQITDIGSVFPANIEAILRLKPGLVLMASGSESVREALKKWGIHVHTFQPRRLKDIAVQMKVLGRLTDRVKSTNALALAFEHALDTLRITPTEKRPSVYWEIWTQPMMTAGSSSFVNDLIEWSGGRNVFSDTNTPWPKVNGEAVVRKRPDFIFSIEDPARGAAQRPWIKMLNLKPNHMIHISSPDLVHRPSPRVLDGLKWLISVLGTKQ
jgi:ABC-type Fe3+-hydroxamate transport system substrate-binding protein